MSVPEVWPPLLTFRELLSLGREEIERLDEQAWTSIDNMKDVWLRAPADREPVPFEDSLGFSQLTWPFLTSAAAALRRSADRTPAPPRADLRIARSIDPVSDEGKALREALDECRFSLHFAIFERDGDDRPTSAVTQAFRKQRAQWDSDVALLLVRAIGIWTELLANIDRDFDSKCSLVYAVLPDIYDFPKEYLGVGWNREMLAHLASIAGLTDVAEKIASDLPLVSARDCFPLVDILTVSDLDDADVLELGRAYISIPGNHLLLSPWELHESPRNPPQPEFVFEGDALRVPTVEEQATNQRMQDAFGQLLSRDLRLGYNGCEADEELRLALAYAAVRVGEIELAFSFFPVDFVAPRLEDFPHLMSFPDVSERESLFLLGALQRRLEERQQRGDELSFQVLGQLAEMRRLSEENNRLLRREQEQREADSERLGRVYSHVQEIRVTVTGLPGAVALEVRGHLDDALAERNWEKALEQFQRDSRAQRAQAHLEERYGEKWLALKRETREDLVGVELADSDQYGQMAPLVAIGICRAFERELKNRLSRMGYTGLQGLGDLLTTAGGVPELQEIYQRARDNNILELRNAAAHTRPFSTEDLAVVRDTILGQPAGLLWKVL